MDEKLQNVKYSNGQTREALLARLPVPGPGRPKETSEKKEAKKILKQYVSEYIERLTKALPLIDPVLVAKAQSGDVPAIKELNDRVLGKPLQKHDLTSAGKPMPLLGGVTVAQHGTSNDSNKETADADEED